MAKLMPFAGTVLHNLLHKPVTTSYPDTPKEYPARTRGQCGPGCPYLEYPSF